MSPRAGSIDAAIDVGSNSVHLLVAERLPAGLVHRRDQSVLLGLGDVVDRQGMLPEATREAVLEALRELLRAAEAEGAQTVTLIGTEPFRRAANAREAVHDVRRALGRNLHVVSSRAEAQLTFLGVTVGRAPDVPTLVVDIGGGSSEVIVARMTEPPAFLSLATGSARLGNGIVLHDPPTPSEFDRLRGGARSVVSALPRARVAAGTFVGGTATNLVRLAPLSRSGLEEVHHVLTSRSATELVTQYAINERRARQLAAGAALVEALLEHFGLAAAGASQASLRDGAILAAASFGDDWPLRLPSLA